MPFVTIIIPTYNRKELLEMAILSVLNQSHEIPFEYEIIIIDDGSRDGTEGYIKKYIEDPQCHITFRYQENGGVGKARNHGISLMNKKSDYLIFLDSDDELINNIINICLEKWWELRNEWVYEKTLGFYFLCEDENKNIIWEKKILRWENERILGYEDYLSWAISIEMWLMTKSSIFLEDPKLRFEEDITTEWVMWAKMWKYMWINNFEIRILDTIGRLYRIHHTGEKKITQTISEEKFRKNAIWNERVIDIIGGDLLKSGNITYYQNILIQWALNWFLYSKKKQWRIMLSEAWKTKKNLKIWWIWILSLLPKKVLLFLYKKYNES